MTMVYATGGKGNQKLIGWSYGDKDEPSNKDSDDARDQPYTKPYYVSFMKPMTVRRVGKIIRRVY